MNAPPATLAGARRRRLLSPLAIILLVGAAARLAVLWWMWSEPLMIEDEQDYSALAASLVESGRFALSANELTSLRPPLYPAFLAAVYSVFGVENYAAVRVIQALLGLATVVIVFTLAKRMYNERVALWAAAFCCFYPSLLGYQNLVLTETLFAFLLCLSCLFLQQFLISGRWTWLVPFGFVWGLATLTRSVLWPFPPLVFLFIVCASKGASWPRRIAWAGIAVAAFGITIAPWAVRNTRLQKTLVTIDVMGGRNFMMGNYEHTPMYRAWDAIGIRGEKSWHQVLAAEDPSFGAMTQGQRDKAAMRRAIQFVLANPGLTAQRCTVKFFNFWQLERSIVAGLGRGWWGDLATPAILLIMLIIFGGYALAMISGVMGFSAAPPDDRRLHWYLLLLVGFVCALHTIAFGHSRYHLALMPLVLIYAGRFWADPWSIWRRRSSLAFWAGAAVCVILVGGWAWEIAFVELERFRQQVLH